MQTNFLGRREFIKYGLISSALILSSCSTTYKKKFALRGISKSFPSEFVNTLSKDWEYFPIKGVDSEKFSYASTLQEKTDLLVLNDGWISSLPLGSLQIIKATKIRDNLSKQARSFLEGIGEDYKNRILPLAVSPWVILLRNEDSLALSNKNSWEVIFSKTLTNQIVFPRSPYLLISIAKKLGFGNDFSKIKNQTNLFDDRNALNWVISGRAVAAVLPFSSCVDSLIEDPRLSVLFPTEGSPLNWTVLSYHSISQEPFPTKWFDLLWGPTYSKRVLRKGFLPPTDFADLRRKNINVPQKYQSIFIPEETIWNKCWSLPRLSLEDKKDLSLNWNNS